jgi:hypothetical protein
VFDADGHGECECVEGKTAPAREPAPGREPHHGSSGCGAQAYIKWKPFSFDNGFHK